MAGVLVIGVIAVVSQTVTAQNRPAVQSDSKRSTSTPTAPTGNDVGAAAQASPGAAPADTAATGKAATGGGTAATGGSGQSGAADSRGSVENVNERTLTFSDKPTRNQVKSVPTFGIWDLVRMVLILGFVVALIYGLFYLLKRSAGGRVNEASSMRLLGSLQLPGNRTIHLVEAGRQVFLVGGGEHSIHLISEITDQESLDDIRLKYQTAVPAGRRNFSDLLSGVLSAAGFSHERKPASLGTGAALTDRPATVVPRRREERPPADAGPPGLGDEPQDRATAGDLFDGGPQEGDAGGLSEPTQFLRRQRERLKRLSQ